MCNGWYMEVSLFDDMFKLIDDVVIVLYCIVQELFINVLKYVYVIMVLVVFDVDDEGVCLCVCDNGCGFFVDIEWCCMVGYYGLLGMEQCVIVLGGMFVIDLMFGGGVMIIVELFFIDVVFD